MSVAAMTMDYGVGNRAGILSGPASPTPSPSPSSPPPPPQSSLYTSYTSSSHHSNIQQQQPTLATTAETVAAAAVAAAEQRQRQLEDELENLKLEQARLAQQSADAQRREKILMRRLANKEQEFQDYVSQIAEYKAAQAPSAIALRSALLDPAVNLLFEKLKKELKATKAKLEETQNELSAWKFTPDSNTGKRLMAKCRLLYQENEELGKMTSNGRLAKLESELAMQKSFSEEVKKSQSELDDFLQELDEDVEGMQSTILFLQQELKTTRDRIQILEKENYQLKNGNETDETEKLTQSSVATDDLTLSQGQITENGLTNKSTPNLISSTSSPLDTIEENACLKNNKIVTNDAGLYNGTSAVAADASMQDITMLEGNGGAIGAKLRTVASRKRNYECDNLVTEPQQHQIAHPVIMVASPRTLPPKKSKLRVSAAIPAQRSTIQTIEENEILMNASAGAALAGTVNNIVDNAVDGMSNEESAASATTNALTTVVEAATTNDSNEQSLGSNNNIVGGGAQRIMTRRRSVRLNGGGGGDSNQ